MSCPKCGSDDWKLAQLVHKEGLTHVQTNSNGVGVGISGGGLGLGVGGSSTEGKYQTAMSVAASPPEDSSEPIMFLLTACCFAAGFLYGWLVNDSIVLGFLAAFIVGIPGAIISGFIAVFVIPDGNYQAQLRLWEKTRMCTRCGCFYRLNEVTPGQEPSNLSTYDYEKQRALRHKYPH